MKNLFFTTLISVTFLFCHLVVNGNEINKDRNQKNGSVKVLLLIPDKLGANFNYNLDVMQEFGWEITTAATTRIAGPCPWGTGVGLENFEVDSLISEIVNIANYRAVAIMPSSWQAINPTQSYLDLMTDTISIQLLQLASSQGIPIWVTCGGSRVLAAANIINGVKVQGKQAYKSEILSAGGIFMGDTALPVIDSNIISCTKDMWYCYQNTQAMATAIENNVQPVVDKSIIPELTKNIYIPLKGVVEWSYTYGTSFSEGAKAICQSPDGGYVMAGNTFATGEGETDILLIKTDGLGNQQWSKTIGGPQFEYAYDIKYGKNGGNLIAGYTTSSGAGGKDMYIGKTDANGNLVWSKTFGGPGLDIAHCIVETDNLDLLIAGYTESFGKGKGDIYLIKTDQDGNVCWAKTFGGTEAEMARKIKLTKDGNYLLLGTTGSKGAGKSDFNLIKLDTAGNIIWDKTYGSANYQDAFDVIETSDKGFAIVGHGDIHGTDLNQVFLVKADSNGVKKWAKTYGSSFNYYDYGKSLAELENGNFLVCGNTKQRTDRKNDAWLFCIDANGVKLWDTIIGSNGSDWITALVETEDHGFVLTGQTNSSGEGSFDTWLFKISNPLVTIQPSGYNPNSEPIWINPNPFRHTTQIQVWVPAFQNGSVSIYNSTGELIKIYPELKPGTHKLAWNTGKFQNDLDGSGIYYVTLQLDKKKFVKKVLHW